jgi:Secretion system C-terminal sorting domain
MRKIITLIFFCLSLQAGEAQTAQQLIDSAKKFPVMPRGSGDLIPFVNGIPTFGSGTPFNDLEFTLYDADYIDGENSGGDVFMPVDPSDVFPGANKVKLIRCILNTDLDAAYGSAKTDRIILGTAAHPNPFFLRGADGKDNDYAVILHLDFRYGGIQLKGQPSDYRLQYATIAQGVETEGWYLFYTANNDIDLVAFIFPCWVIEPAVSGNPPNNLNPICNADSILSLNNPSHFRFAQPIVTQAAVTPGIKQFGSDGKEIIGGMATDAQGYTYLFGMTDGNLDGQTDAENEMFVTKIAPNGTTVWVTELAMKEGTFLKAGTTDDEYIYVAGRTLGNLPGFTNAGRWDGILLKLKLSDGQITAMNQWGNEGIDGYGNIAQDDAGNIFVSAQGSPAGPATTDPDYLVAKHRKIDLSNVWRVIEPTTATGFSASAEAWGGLTYVPGTTAGDGRLIVAGWYIATGGANAFSSVYENLNATAPTRPHSITIASPGGARADWILDNVVDKQGNIYFGGFTTGNFQGNHLGEGDAYIVKYSPQLTNPMFKQFGTTKSDLIYKLEIDSSETIYAVGYTYGNYAGSNSDPTLGTGDIFIQKFDKNLNFIGNKQFGTPHEDRANTSLRNGILYLGGITEGSMVNANLGSFDGFVVAVKANDLSFANPGLITGVGSINPANSFVVYPNPVTDILYIKGLSNIQQQYGIYNSTGQLVLSGTNLTATNNRINTASLSGGLYCISVIINGKETTTKFLKVNK